MSDIERDVPAPFRLPAGGRIDRGTNHRFTFGGRTLTGHPGDTLASALLAHGVHQTGTSIKLGRPRGIAAAWAEDPNSLVQVEEPFPEPMLLATTIELTDGLVAHGIPGQGRLADVADSARYDVRHVHPDLLVVGAGPAGLSAALTAARAGARVVLIDEQSEAGGALLGTNDLIDGGPALDWVRRATAELAEFPEVLHLQRTTAFGHFDDGFVLALERRTDHFGAAAPRNLSRQRVWRVRARRVLVAAGAHERPVVFSDNDRPGIMLAGGARTFLHRYGVLAGRAAVVFTTDDSAYAAAVDLSDAGVEVRAIVDARPEAPGEWLSACASRGIPVRTRQVVTGTDGVERVTAALVAPLDAGVPGEPERVDCDLLLVSGGWNPAVHLFSQAGGTLRYNAALGAFVPNGALDRTTAAGAAAGVFDLAGCLVDGRRAAAAVLDDLGVTVAGEESSVTAADGPARTPSAVLWRVPDTGTTDRSTQFVDLQRDATVADIARAVDAGMRTVEHIKRYTTIGTAHDQGKTSGVIASGITAELLGRPIDDLGTTTFRPPYTPVAFAALAGRNRGSLFDPERTTAPHAWHLERGAVWEDVGQWKRPRYFPQPGEDMETAVLRECAAVRGSVGIMDGSTLGKIDVQGPDAAAFLDMLYTNMMSSLKVGSVRYGVMCRTDGMVLDDGTVQRLDRDRFLVYTTTGGAAGVLEWMEDWLQTEWPHLRVHVASVTEQWATFPVVGPRSRDVVAAVTGLDTSKEAFPFMTWQDTRIGDVRVRVARVSFSGELAFEVNVDGWHAPAVWERLVAAGEPYGITPYGTETMHVLRAEKAYPIIGQDTDGTVTPHDLGMAWAVSKKKPDFLGKRSFARDHNNRPDRKHLVGLLAGGPHLRVGRGLADRRGPDSSRTPRAHARGRHLELPQRRAGPELRPRPGEGRPDPRRPDGRRAGRGELVPAEITEPVLVDPEGARRDG